MNTVSTSCQVLLIITAVVMIGGNCAKAQDDDQPTAKKDLEFVPADSSFSIKFTTYFQVRYQGEDNPSSGDWNDRLLIRRARVKFAGFAYSPKLQYEFQFGLSNNDIGTEQQEENNFASNIVLDAVVKWNVLPNLDIWFGQTKLPGNRERLVSSQKTQFVDRSLLNSEFNLDRDIGLQIHHEHQLGTVLLREIGAVSMGEGRNITVNNAGGYDYTARLEILPFGEFKNGGDYFGGDIEREQTPKLALAAAFDYNDGASREEGQTGNFLREHRDLRTLFVDAMFKYRGFSAMAEYANKKAPDGPVVLMNNLGEVEETFITGNAFNIQAGYLFLNNWEIAGRYTNFDPTRITSLAPEKQYTLGLSKYLTGHKVKVQADATLNDFPETDSNIQCRLQVALGL
jgi:phosphate-selective porin OprO/OprP